MAPEIKTLTVLGAGTMGRGIAHVAAVAGFSSHLYDTQEAALRRNLGKGVELKKLAPETAEAALANLHLHTSLPEAVENAGLVIEAVPEDMALKIETFHA